METRRAHKTPKNDNAARCNTCRRRFQGPQRFGPVKTNAKTTFAKHVGGTNDVISGCRGRPKGADGLLKTNRKTMFTMTAWEWSAGASKTLSGGNVTKHITFPRFSRFPGGPWEAPRA